MRVLFVHQNFPAQFVHVAPALAARGHDVLGMTTDQHKNPSPVPVLRYKWTPRAFETRTHGLGATYAEMTYRGQVVATAAAELRSKRGYVPDIVFGSIGWGETLFLREVWPEARHLLYAELFYRPRGLDVGFDPEYSSGSLASRMAVTARQGHLLLAINGADKLLSPTRWQASSFPADVQSRMTVIHDGIDTDRVRPAEGAASVQIPSTQLRFRKGDELLTFINRNLEPHRGCHIFLRALPAVLEARPHAQVVVVGGNGRSYSPSPGPEKSWKQIFLDEVGPRLDMSRVHFVGQIPYATFVDLMRVTRVHAYLTYPFVLSWSMLEAMSAGALVIGSRTPPVEEVIEHGSNGLLVDFFDVEAWSEALIEALAEPARFDHLRREARRSIVERYDLRTRCLPRLLDFIEQA